MNSNLNPILLVDDSANDVELIVAGLAEIPVSNPIVVQHDGEEALTYLHSHCAPGASGKPVVVLLDIKMPKINGIEVLKAMKADPALKDIPVVMLTSSREGPDIEISYKLGANAYVVKPVDFEEFFQAVKEVGKFWAVVNEPPPGVIDAALAATGAPTR